MLSVALYKGGRTVLDTFGEQYRHLVNVESTNHTFSPRKQTMSPTL